MSSHLLSQVTLPKPTIAAVAKIDIYDYQHFLGNFLARTLVFAMLIAGLFFLFKLITAGYTYLTSTGDPAKIQAATKEISNASVGLGLIITTYFIGQIIESVLGVNIF